MRRQFFSAYFEKQQGVFTREELLSVVSTTSLDIASGMPFFIFDRKYALSGAQTQEVFDSAVARMIAEDSH